MKAVRVLLVDDSAICRAGLRDMLERDGDIRVVAETSNGEAIVALIERHKPQLVAVDLEMPGVGGLETIERAMARAPLPILVVSGISRSELQRQAFEAVRRGALDVAEKPGFYDTASQRALRAKVRALACVPVVRHVIAERSLPTPEVGHVARAGGAAPANPLAEPIDVVGVAASAGGPASLASLLSALPPDSPVAIAIVQHLPVGFARSFAEFLQGRTSLRVCIVTEPMRVEAGTVYLAPDDRHLLATSQLRLAPHEADPVDGHRPSATVLFSSLAAVFGRRSMGVILSGMGRDGVAGLSILKGTGACTIAQDAATSAVFGMPKAAMDAGAACFSANPAEIAHHIRRRAVPRKWDQGEPR